MTSKCKRELMQEEARRIIAGIGHPEFFGAPTSAAVAAAADRSGSSSSSRRSRRQAAAAAPDKTPSPR